MGLTVGSALGELVPLLDNVTQHSHHCLSLNLCESLILEALHKF